MKEEVEKLVTKAADASNPDDAAKFARAAVDAASAMSIVVNTEREKA